MAKLFITLYLMVIASFGVFAVYVGSISYFGEMIGEGAIIDKKISKGTFMLLNNSLDGLSKAQIDKLLEQYKRLFGNEFKLLESSELDLDEGDLNQLNKNKFISIDEIKTYDNISDRIKDDEDKVTIYYSKRPNSTQVWRVEVDYNLDLSINEKGIFTKIVSGNFSNGMMFLIQSKLSPSAPTEWEKTINELQPSFGLPLKLTTLKDIPQGLDDRELILSSLKKNKAVNISQGTKFATFAKQIPNSNKLLQVGPIEVPWYIRNMPLLFVLAFGLSFATTLFIWIWPLWSNLMRLQKASDEFGAGEYDTRIPLKKLSPIKKVTQAFNGMAEQTQRSIRSQKELTSAVSHELRTPVARMRFALEMLNASDNKGDKTRYINAITEDINELDLLLEELLSYARFDQKDLQLNPSLIKIIPWINNSMEKLMPLAGNKELRYLVKDIKVDETNHFEPRLLSRVLDNLVQNGLRYAKSKVKVTFKRDDDIYLLIVEDDGEGIPEDKRDNIFDAFSRIDASRDRASGGFGLGLAIVDRIAKAHKGSVSVQSSYLGGARFEVRIPKI